MATAPPPYDTKAPYPEAYPPAGAVPPPMHPGYVAPQQQPAPMMMTPPMPMMNNQMANNNQTTVVVQQQQQQQQTQVVVKNRPNHVLHFIICLICPWWIIVWVIVCITQGC